MTGQFELFSQLHDLRDLRDQFDLFARFMKAEFNYDAVRYGLYVNTSSHHRIYSDVIGQRSGGSLEWAEQYRREALEKQDLAMLMAALGRSPMLQSQFYHASEQDEIAPRFAGMVRRVRDYVRCGVVIPVEHNGHRGVVGLYSSERDAQQHDNAFARHKDVIEGLAGYFHRSCHWADEVIAQTGISDMNLQVLRMKAQGLRVKEILYQIGRNNPKTVDNHMARMRKLLDTRNDSQTIAKAASLGLLAQPDVVSWRSEVELPSF
jgi:DNA-binding CsgD family transcriptional regulator